MRISPLLPLILHTLLLLICFQNLMRNRHDGIVERGERERCWRLSLEGLLPAW
jgi:hypothetical protein